MTGNDGGGASCERDAENSGVVMTRLAATESR